MMACGATSGMQPETRSGDEPLWRPAEARRLTCQLARFEHWLSARHSLEFEDYDAFWQWSVDEPELFWKAVWDYFDLRSETPVGVILDEPRMPGARWFPGTRVNFTSQVMRHATEDRPAIVYESEAIGAGELSWADLRGQVGAFAQKLSALGVRPGDRVAAYLPNVPHTVVAFLAAASLGAIWSVCAPEMGEMSVLDRLRQITPSVLIACDGYRYGGKPHERAATVDRLLDELPSVRHLIMVPLLGMHGNPVRSSCQVHLWDDCVRAANDVPPILPAALSFDHPLWIVYSSGTSGLPKPIMHGHGGVMLSAMVMSGLHSDLSREDRFYWTSSTGWIVWNIQVTALLLGTTLVLYDGSPTGANPGAPDWNTLWALVARRQVTAFGAGAAFFASCLKAGLEPGKEHDLSLLRTLGSTGSPLSPEAYRWIYRAVGDVWLMCPSGGTDIVGAFVGGHPGLPVYEGEMQCRILGVAVHAFNDEGRPVVDEVGELVCTAPMPSMPLCLWGDVGNARYRSSYFDFFAHLDGSPIWRHGDWLRLVPRPGAMGAVICGRSDATINRQGIRTGTAEIYRAVEAIAEITDSLVVDLESPGRPSYMPLFVTLPQGQMLTEPLKQRIRRAIRAALTPRHEPDEIFHVPGIPRTLTGKKMELPIKRLLSGQALSKVANRDAMSNPESLDWFLAFARERADGGV